MERLIYAAIATHGKEDRDLKIPIKSILPFVDKIAIFHGAWDGMENLDSSFISRDFALVNGEHGKNWHDENSKRVFMANWGGPGSWCFFLDSDERLVAGGEHIRTLTELSGLNTFKVTVIEKGKSMFRENMFRYKAFDGQRFSSSTAIVIEHLGLGKNHIP